MYDALYTNERGQSHRLLDSMYNTSYHYTPALDLQAPDASRRSAVSCVGVCITVAPTGSDARSEAVRCCSVRHEYTMLSYTSVEVHCRGPTQSLVCITKHVALR